MKVILISGKAQHGKDTTAQFLKEALEQKGQRVLIAHYGDLLKYICRTFFDWDGQKDEAGRSLLQRVGTDVVRKQDPTYWADFIGSFLYLFPDEWDFILIPDCRFPNEVDALREEWCFNATHLRVVRPGFDNGLTPEQQAHPSETALDGIEPDVFFYNVGSLELLRTLADNYVETLVVENPAKVIAIDFDGCLCVNNWPYIGAPNWAVIERAKQEQQNGAKLILWTCREGDALDRAVEACAEWGLYFDAVNENLPERIAQYDNDPRKVGADEYWDDKAVRVEVLK